MEALISPKTEYLLQGGLEVLHEQSYEWLSEVDFIKEEISFFNTLLKKKDVTDFPTEQLAALSKKLTSFNSDLTVLHNKIIEHERWLADMIKTNTLGRQESYRKVHREVMEDVKKRYADFVQLKKDIFSFVK